MTQIVSRADPLSVCSAKVFSQIVSRETIFRRKMRVVSCETRRETICETIFPKPMRRRGNFVVSRETMNETMHLQCIVFSVSFRIVFLGAAAKRFYARRCRSPTGAMVFARRAHPHIRPARRKRNGEREGSVATAAEPFLTLNLPRVSHGLHWLSRVLVKQTLFPSMGRTAKGPPVLFLHPPPGLAKPDGAASDRSNANAGAFKRWLGR